MSNFEHTAYFLLFMDIATGRIEGVGIYGDDSPTTNGRGVFLQLPGLLAKAPTYHEAQERLREVVLPQYLNFRAFGPPGAAGPLYEAVKLLMEEGTPVRVPWPRFGEFEPEV